MELNIKGIKLSSKFIELIVNQIGEEMKVRNPIKGKYNDYITALQLARSFLDKQFELVEATDPEAKVDTHYIHITIDPQADDFEEEGKRLFLALLNMFDWFKIEEHEGKVKIACMMEHVWEEARE